MARLKVYNKSNVEVVRGGSAFPPLQSKEVTVNNSKAAEIRACRRLDVETVEEVVEGEQETSEEQGVRCPHCDFVAKSKAGLTAHVNSKHSESG